LKDSFIEVEPKYTVTSWKLPFEVWDRNDLRKVQILSPFSVYRKNNLKGHKHSGIDIVPLNQDKYVYVFPIADGIVCFIRIDPPFSTVVIKHKLNDDTYLYSSYIHLKDVYVSLGQYVVQNINLGRLFTNEEAWKYNGLMITCIWK